jgi:hypothetical protein
VRDPPVVAPCSRPGVDCESASNLGSDADLVHRASFGADKSGLEQVDLCATVHLALHELEPSDLALGLSIRPWQDNCGTHCESAPNLDPTRLSTKSLK